MFSKPKARTSVEYLISAFSSVWLGVSDHKDVVYSSTLSKPSKSKHDQPCEYGLEEAELKYREAIHWRIGAEERVDRAMKTLRSAEEAYSLVCDSLRKQASEFGENRIELELAIARIESTLQSANQEAKNSLRHLKACEDSASEFMLILRQAEIDHENSQRLTQRTKALDNGDDINSRDMSREPIQQCSEFPSSSEIIAGACAEPSTPRVSTYREDLRAKLANLGITVSAEVSDTVLQRIYAATTGAFAPFPMPSPNPAGDTSGGPLLITGPPRAGAPPPSVRLLCIGRAAPCMGQELSAGGPGARDARDILAALGGTAAVQVCCQRRHGLVVAQSGELFAWGDAAAGRLGIGPVPAVDGEGAYAARPVVVEALRGVIVTQVAASAWHSLALSADGQVVWVATGNDIVH
jgi:hypothetical protein